MSWLETAETAFKIGCYNDARTAALISIASTLAGQGDALADRVTDLEGKVEALAAGGVS